MTTSEGRGKCVRRHTRVSSLDQLELDKAVNSGGKNDNGKVSKSMFNLRAAATSDEDGKVTKPRLEVLSKRPPSGRKQGVHDGNVYLARDLESGEEEVVVCHHGNDPNSVTTLCDIHKAAFPPRLLIVSSKIRSSVTLRNALQPNVIFVQYRYDSATLDEILSLVEKGLSSMRVVSIAFVLSCSGSSILLSGKEDRALTRETLQEPHPVHRFLRDLVTSHLEVSSAHSRIDFLACHAALSSDGRQIAKDIQSILNIPVGISKDIEGQEVCCKAAEGDVSNGKGSILVGGLYFNLERLRGWGGHYQQSLAGFEKIRTVGKGAYGAAVLYRKKDDDSLVILKEINMHDLNAAERNLALNEVKVLAMLDHPNIISYYDSFEEDGVIMIEMEYADGGTMAQYLAQQEQPLEEKEILAMFQQVVAAIRHIHQHNILHRDLKTANIFLTKEGVVKVGDFGISKMLSSANKGANTVLGTPYYISPEMCEGKDYNDRSDIWALGCILYELACLQKTFEGSNLPALVNKIMKGQFAPVKGSYSPELKQLIAELLLQKPEDRPSANEILYQRLPEMLSRYEEVTSDLDDDLMSSAGSVVNKKKRVRSVLYYLDTSTLNLTPIELPSRLKIREVAVGADHVIAVTMERQVYTWGEGSQGQLGHGDQQMRLKPQLVETLKGKSICRVSCGAGFSVFGSDNGIVMTCGAGEDGCLGHGDWCNALRPRLIEPLLSVDVISLACGPRHVAVVGSAGEIFSWGCGENGRLGLGTEENHCQPMEVIALEDLTVTVREVFCGVDGTMFLTDVGSVYACGNNEYNKLGLNNRQGFLMAMKNIFTKTEVEGKKAPTPVRALGRHRVVDVAMGPQHSAVVVDPGIIYTFGNNVDGQLGTGNTKPQNAPTEIKMLSNSVINRVQCGENFTSASSTIDELFFWGLRYKAPVADQCDSLNSSGNGNVTLREKDDARAESVTPRKGGHSRQASNASVNSNASSKDACPMSPEAEGQTSGKTAVPPSPERQVSNDSVFLHGDEGPISSADSTRGSSLRPLGSAPRRSLSASSTSKDREKDRDKDQVPEGAERILNPTLILRLMDTAEVMSLASFYCHEDNLLVQVETTAPPPARRKSRKKRSFRKRFSRNLIIPSAVIQGSASSREGGDEYSSEASEMDSQGPLPDWLKEELAVKDDSDQGEVNDGNEEDDTSDLSEDEVRRRPVDNSMSSIQINRELKRGQGKTQKKKIPSSTDRSAVAQNEDSLKVAHEAEGESSSGRGRSLSVNSRESGEQELVSSSGSEILGARNETKKLKSSGIPVKKVTMATNLKIAESPFKKSSGVGGQKPLSKIRAMGRGRGRPSSQDTRDQSEQLAARGFVSDVTVKRREETLQNELEKMRDEKRKADEKMEEMERRHRHELEQRHLMVARKAQETEAQLKAEIDKLRRELLNHSSQLQNNQKVVLGLQEQLVKVEAEQRSLNLQKLPGSNSSTPRQGAVRESKVCVIQ